MRLQLGIALFAAWTLTAQDINVQKEEALGQQSHPLHPFRNRQR